MISLLQSEVDKYMEEVEQQKTIVFKVEETWQKKCSKFETELKERETELTSLRQDVAKKVTENEGLQKDTMRWKIRAEELEITNKDFQKRIIEKEKKIRDDSSDDGQ